MTYLFTSPGPQQLLHWPSSLKVQEGSIHADLSTGWMSCGLCHMLQSPAPTIMADWLLIGNGGNPGLGHRKRGFHWYVVLILRVWQHQYIIYILVTYHRFLHPFWQFNKLMFNLCMFLMTIIRYVERCILVHLAFKPSAKIISCRKWNKPVAVVAKLFILLLGGRHIQNGIFRLCPTKLPLIFPFLSNSWRGCFKVLKWLVAKLWIFL